MEHDRAPIPFCLWRALDTASVWGDANHETKPDGGTGQRPWGAFGNWLLFLQTKPKDDGRGRCCLLGPRQNRRSPQEDKTLRIIT
jgi:hypothetical protein